MHWSKDGKKKARIMLASRAIARFARAIARDAGHDDQVTAALVRAAKEVLSKYGGNQL